MIQKLIEEIYKQIASLNAKDTVDAIPHSDTFGKKLEAELGIERHETSKIVNILKEAHRIVFIEVIKEDKFKDVKRIVGYVISDLPTIRRLRTYFQNKLIEEYQNQFKHKLPLPSIIREVLMKASGIKNSLIGQIANKALMLEEYENLITKEYAQFSEQWKSTKLQEILRQMAEAQQNVKPITPDIKKSQGKVDQNRRAVDSDTYQDYVQTSQNQPVKKILMIYGIEFFLRVNLRKYNFKLLTELVEKREINGKEDLKIMKSMLERLKSNFDKDPKLAEYEDDIKKLDKTVLLHLVSTRSH